MLTVSFGNASTLNYKNEANSNGLKSLGFENIRVQENRTPGFGWLVVNYPGQGIIPKVCVESASENIVSVTLPDGEIKKFKAKASPECNQFIPILDVDIVFEAMGDDNGAKLEALDNRSGRLVGGSLDNLDNIGNSVTDPDRYKLTTEEGREFIIDQNEGVREIY